MKINVGCSSLSNLNVPVMFYLPYSKTGTKWMWDNFFKRYFSCLQINIANSPEDSVIRFIESQHHKRPIVIRHTAEYASFGGYIKDLPDLIHRLLPDAPIVISIRSQQSLLSSHYNQYVEGGGTLSFRSYVNKVTKGKWRYYDQIKVFYDCFGGDKVFVMLFEEFKKNKQVLMEQLIKHVGMEFSDFGTLKKLLSLSPINTQRSDLVLDCMLLLNRLRMRGNRAKMPVIGRKGHDHILVELAAYWDRLIKKITRKQPCYRKFNDRGVVSPVYTEANNALSKLIGKDLKAYGYP